MNITIKHCFFLLFISLILSSCSQNHKTSHSSKQATIYQTGIASYYANKYQGRQTASGERFNQNKPTAAHKTLSFGTKVKVTNISNGRSVVVRINDRGPFVKDRIIDLSKSAFSVIANSRLGLVDVYIEIIH